MIPAHEVLARIQALPATEQRLAVVTLQRMIEARRAEQPAQRMDPVTMAHAVGLEPDPWQLEVLQSPADRLTRTRARPTAMVKGAGPGRGRPTIPPSIVLGQP